MEIGRGRRKGNVFVMLIVERFGGLGMQKFHYLYYCPEQLQSDIKCNRRQNSMIYRYSDVFSANLTIIVIMILRFNYVIQIQEYIIR